MSRKQASRWLLVFGIFFGDIKVRAVNVEVPAGCSKSDQKCSFLVNQNPFDIVKSADLTLRARKGSSYTRVSSSELELVRGLFWIESSGTVTVRTLYGQIALAGGAALVDVQDGQVKFVNLSAAELKYEPRGEGKKHALPVGYATYFASVKQSGVADTGFPHPAEIEPLIKTWTQLYGKNELSLFTSHFENFLQDWRIARDTVAGWYVDTVQRAIASHEEEMARQARLKAEREAADRQYRDLFRQRFLNP